MRCEDIKLKLVDYYEEALSSGERKLVQAHLNTCPSCQKEFQEIALTFELLKKETPFEPKEIYWVNFVPGVRSRIEKERDTRIVPIPKFKIARTIVSVVLILLLGVFLFKVDRRVMFKSSGETYTYLLPAEDENIRELLYVETAEESSFSYFFTEADRKKLALAEEELEGSYWTKGGKEKSLEELNIKQIKDLKENLEKTKFKKELL